MAIGVLQHALVRSQALLHGFEGLGLKKRFFFTVIFVDNFMVFFAKAIGCYWFCLYLYARGRNKNMKRPI